MIKFLKTLFSKKELTETEQAKRIIRRMGYKKDGGDTFVKEASHGKTMIWLINGGVKIKVYAGGYAESDFLSQPLEKEKLKRFIRSNQL